MVASYHCCIILRALAHRQGSIHDTVESIRRRKRGNTRNHYWCAYRPSMLPLDFEKSLRLIQHVTSPVCYCPVLPYPVLSCPALSCAVLPCLLLSSIVFLTLPYLAVPCPTTNLILLPRLQSHRRSTSITSRIYDPRSFQLFTLDWLWNWILLLQLPEVALSVPVHPVQMGRLSL